jgi:acrylyl-CoA reductase (NADPH)
METKKFRALWVEEVEPGKFTRRVVERSTADLPPGEVLVKVLYSSLNYKDALSASGNRGVTRNYPHTPGIDAAGVVEETSNPYVRVGEQVIITATEMGSSIPGGFGQYVRVRADKLTRLPSGMAARESMAYGTAGLTAALCVERLRWAGLRPAGGHIVVTGATGGVGMLAVALLAGDGFEVTAATGKLEQAGLLKRLGAREVIQRDELNDTSGKALLSGRWAAAVDTVGGNYLATVIRSTKAGGLVACCGNAASAELALTVYPFILRGVSLLGVDATQANAEMRQKIWRKLAHEWRVDRLDELVREVPLDGLDAEIETILKGGQVGRVVVNLWS